MYCARCGNHISDGEQFCSSCGQALPQKNEVFSNPVASDPEFENKKGGKSPKKGIIAAAAIAFVVLAAVLVYANIWKIMPAKSYYAFLEVKNKPISLNKLYNDVKKAAKLKPFSKELEITVGEAKGLAGMTQGIILGDVSLTVQIDYSEKKTASYLSLNYEDSELLDAIFYTDKDSIGFGLPILYNENFYCDTKNIPQVLTDLMGQQFINITADAIAGKSVDEIRKELDNDTKLLDKALAKYAKIAYSNVSSDSFKKRDAGDTNIYSWISGSKKRAVKFENCSEIEVKITEKDMYKISDKVFEALQGDDKLIDLIVKYSLSTGYMSSYMYYNGYFDGIDYEDIDDTEFDYNKIFKEMLADAREDLEYEFDPESDDVIMTMKVIADNKNNIISREIIVDSERISLATYNDKEDNKVIELNYDDRYSDIPTAVYVYSGLEGKGIKALIDNETIEASITGSEDGKSDIGLDYGTYKIKYDSDYESYEFVLSADKDDSGKGGDKLKLRCYQDNNQLFVLNADVKNLKDKSNLNFSKKSALNLYDLDEDEIQDIVNEIQQNFMEITMNLFY